MLGWTDAALSQFAMGDILRRAQGHALEAFGLGPSECPYRIVASGAHWRMRDYADTAASPSLLIVAAPIKRPYIWDLTPSASTVRLCLRQHLHVYLLEWMPASRETASNGLDEYTDAISRCVAQITGETPGAKTFLIGHSLGGTLAAIFGALAPEKLSGLALLSAPLCFQPGTSRFRDALTSLVPPDLSETDPLPGSLLSHMSALASPNTFVWSRLTDAFLSMTDHNALDIHARVERWALDEVPLPGKLVHQIIEWLYRENRLCRATLKVGETRLDPFRLSIPMLAIVNTVDEVAPLASVKPLADAMPVANVRIIEFPGEMGVCFQHLAILIGRRAHAQVWPEIISWLNSRGH